MSAKELGMIHVVNTQLPLPFGSQVGALSPIGDIDLPGELTTQLQKMVRQGNFFKVVGIDISVDLDGVQQRDVYVQGYLRYFAPTRGRCKAYRDAFKAMAEQMKNQGISMRDNAMYDFRTPINQIYEADFRNQASLNGVDGLALDHANPQQSIFAVHNTSVQPQFTGTTSELFSEGFSTLLGSGTDFVLNDTKLYQGNEDFASVQYEKIPFQLEMSSVPDNSVTPTFQFRPDPALYLAVLAGQLQVVIQDIRVDPQADLTNPATLRIATMVSGWKSVMGNPDKKKKSTRRKSSRKSSNKKA